MPLAYLILAHKNPQQIFRLLKAIHSPENFCAIHIDKKSSRAVHDAVVQLARLYANVQIIPPHSIHWGGWSMVQATLDGIGMLLQMGDWTHFSNLSGQDYPLKSNAQIAAKLSQNPGINFLETKEVAEPHRLARINCFHLELPTRVYRLPIARNIQRRWTPYWGSQWFTATRSFAEFALSPPAQAFRKFFRHSSIPDESFFPTLAMNTNFRNSVSPTNLRFIDWPLDATGQLAHHPRALTSADLPQLLASDCLFARKFDEEKPIDELDRYRASHK